MKKKNRNRRTAAVLAAVILAAGVFGCGSKEPSGQASTQESPAQTEESHGVSQAYSS